MIGYAQESKAYKLWDPKKGRTVVSREVQFDEKFVSDKIVKSSLVLQQIESESAVVLDYGSHQNSSGDTNSTSSVPDQPHQNNSNAIQDPPVSETATDESAENSTGDEQDQDTGNTLFNLESPVAANTQTGETDNSTNGIRRSTRIRKFPTAFWKSFITT